MDNDKKLLRAECKKIRKTLNSNLSSSKICSNIVNWDVFNRAKNVLLFYPIGNELSLLDLLKIKDKNFYFPCVAGDDIYVSRYTSLENFITGKYSIPEPSGDRCSDCSFLELAFIPALAVDVSGNRLGYGKGYYDRFLKKYPDIITAVPQYAQLCLDSIPNESFDVPVDYIINESGVATTRL